VNFCFNTGGLYLQYISLQFRTGLLRSLESLLRKEKKFREQEVKTRGKDSGEWQKEGKLPNRYKHRQYGPHEALPADG